MDRFIIGSAVIAALIAVPLAITVIGIRREERYYTLVGPSPTIAATVVRKLVAPGAAYSRQRRVPRGSQHGNVLCALTRARPPSTHPTAHRHA